jgi:regulator of sigma E protease
MDFWIKAGQLMLSLAILITLHEFGHYLAARLFKIRVEKFYLFFDPWFSLLKKKIGDTEWGIGWLPLGGYVKIAGMIDESMDKEQMAQPPKEDEFRSKPAWQRLIVMIGGVAVNIVVGFLIYIVVVASWGETVIQNDSLKYGLSVNKDIRDLDLGIEDGDIITKVEGKEVENVNAVNLHVFLRDYRNLEIQKPDGTIKEITLPQDIDDYMWEKGAMFAFEIRRHTIVKLVNEDSDAFAKGLQPGDSIVMVNGKETPFYHLFAEELSTLEGDSAIVPFGFYRGDEYITEDITIQYNSKEERYMLGIVLEPPHFVEPVTLNFGLAESISRGFSKAGWTMHDYAAQLPLLFTSQGAKNVGGFGAIGSLFPSSWDWERFWLNTAFISLVLAIMNILPIPALDGGHIVFLLYEMITGREAPQKVLELAQVIGFFIIIGLVLYANGNDIYRTFFK